MAFQNEGTFRSHQVPITKPATNPEHLKQLEDWLKSYHPEELFDDEGKLKPELAELAPKGESRMGANPQTNGGRASHDLFMPDFRNYAFDLKTRSQTGPGDTLILGEFVRDIIKMNLENFRLFGPDETLSK